MKRYIVRGEKWVYERNTYGYTGYREFCIVCDKDGLMGHLAGHFPLNGDRNLTKIKSVELIGETTRVSIDVLKEELDERRLGKIEAERQREIQRLEEGLAKLKQGK